MAKFELILILAAADCWRPSGSVVSIFSKVLASVRRNLLRSLPPACRRLAKRLTGSDSLDHRRREVQDTSAGRGGDRLWRGKSGVGYRATVRLGGRVLDRRKGRRLRAYNAAWLSVAPQDLRPQRLLATELLATEQVAGAKKSPDESGLVLIWCPREDSNLHSVATTRT